tara:strand:+ start:4355 stop:4642 length:288 start_codon:yes stop_codon:yes gene_type:complete
MEKKMDDPIIDKIIDTIKLQSEGIKDLNVCLLEGLQALEDIVKDQENRLRKIENTLGEELATHEFIKANGRYPTYSELHGPSDWKKVLREHHGGT